MGRGFLLGILWGVVVAAGVLVVASQVGTYLDMKLPEPEAAAVAMPAGSEFNRERPDETPVLPQTDGRPGTAETPGVIMPEPTREPTPDTTPLDTPETAPLDRAAMAEPDATVAAPPDITLSTDPVPAPASIAPPDTPVIDVTPSPAPVPATPEAGNVTEEINNPAPVPDTPPVSLPASPAGLIMQVPTIDDMAPGVTTDRLPRIGAEPKTNHGAVQPALQRYATDFETPAGVPLMSIILIDTGADRPDPATLSDFPVPLSVAIDPLASDAKDVAAAYRAAGVEVLALTPLADGATPADVEVAFQEFLAAVPEAVAVMDTPAAVLQENRPRAVQVVEILAEGGQGLVTYDHGLNAALQVASGQGVHAAVVYRAFDDGVRDAAAMKRFLSQGGFRAAQDGPVIMVGRTRAETLAALAEWRLGSRAATIAMAPVSAILMSR